MNFRTLALTLALWGATAAASSASDAQLGTWALNGSKSIFPEGMSRNATVVYEAAGDKIKITIDGVDKDAKPTHGVWVGKFDGQFYPVKGNLEYDAMKLTTVNDRTAKIAAAKNGKEVWNGKSAVSRNGKSRTLTVAGKTAAGKKYKGKAVYDKK